MPKHTTENACAYCVTSDPADNCNPDHKLTENCITNLNLTPTPDPKSNVLPV